ncbi:MAG: 30S ribosomal protein S12 methylthiotransferase RimO [Dehalococcoidia bacterium]|nr:30S ribosomal protein S12 methylthiotransferase RimO [Dehalococcoidia bacterium]
MRYHLVTLGCPKNAVDSRRLEWLLGERGAQSSPLKTADFIIVNTCGFIDAAKEESINAVLRLAMNKRPGQKLLVAGCLTELYAAQLAEEIPEIDHLFGVEAWDAILRLIDGADAGEKAKDGPKRREPAAAAPSAYLKIADGCNARCSFCVIPRIKGRLHSTPPAEVVAEARRLASEGVRELVLVAQDTTAYGRDLGMRDGLPALVERLAADVPEAAWIRIMYAYPGHITQRLLRVMAATPQVCHYLDVPLQHISADVLRRMRRPHDALETRRMLERVRGALPDAALRTTFLVGFPGETERDFGELLDFVREVKFEHVGAFTFSPQEGTEAARLPDQVPERVKRRRYRELMETARRISLGRNREWLGREMVVLVESGSAKSKSGERVFAGRSYRDAPEIDGLTLCTGEATPGEMLTVRIKRALPYDLLAERVDAPSPG